MAEITGENGAVYYNEGLTNTSLAGSITFSTGADGYIITSSTNGATGKISFLSTGWTTGMLVEISGCSSGSSTDNDRTCTINTVASYALTVDEVLITGTDTGAITFLEADPGIQMLGFYNWTLGYTGDAVEVTNFDSPANKRSYIPGLTSWTAAADRYFLTAGNEVEDWVGTEVEIRLFLNYVAETSGAPSSGNISQYWKGDTIVTGIDTTTPVDAMITQSISFQGDRALTLKTQDDPWSCGIST